MKLLEKYANLPEAYLVKGMLESNGIPVVVQADALSQIFPGPAGGEWDSLAFTCRKTTSTLPGN